MAPTVPDEQPGDRAAIPRAARRPSPVLRLPVEQAPAHAAPDLDALLARAVSIVSTEWEREVGDGHAADQVAARLSDLCETARRRAAGDASATCAFPPDIPARRMLDRLRATLLAEVAGEQGEPDGAALVRLLRGFEDALEMIERDAAQRFASRLAGPDGLELLVDVAHDLRSPLTSILFLAETLHGKRSGPVNAVQERQLGLIYSAAFGLNAITNDLIELARGGERLLDTTPVPFSLTEIMQSVHDIVRPIAEEKGLEMRMRLADAADHRVGQPTALTRTLLNLTTNALKFTDSGHVEMSAVARSQTRLEFSVLDTGPGLAPEVLSVLFEPFRRRYRPGEYTFSSSGLGLAMVRKLVLGMGSELQVESAPDQGTRFHFTLELPVMGGL